MGTIRISQFRGLDTRAEPGDVHPYRASEQVNCYAPRAGELTQRQGLAYVDHDNSPAINNPPFPSTEGNTSVDADSELTFVVNTSEPDSDGLRYFLGRAPVGASVQISGGTFSWTPTSSQVGSHEIDLVACDDEDPCRCSYETITVTVNP